MYENMAQTREICPVGCEMEVSKRTECTQNGVVCKEDSPSDIDQCIVVLAIF